MTEIRPKVASGSARRTSRALLVGLAACIACMLLPATSSALTRPETAGVPWGAAQPLPANPGPPLVEPPASRFPQFNGNGYSVYVCRAARDAGYSGGHMNEAFELGGNYTDTVQGNEAGVAINAGARAFPSLAAATSQFDVHDTCDSGGSMVIRRNPGSTFLWGDRGPTVTGGMSIGWGFGVGGSLHVQHYGYDMNMGLHKTGGNAGRFPNVISEVLSLTSSGKPNARSCTGIGRWGVSPETSNGGYPASEGWRDGSSEYPVRDGSRIDGASLGSVFNNPFYGWNPGGYGQPWTGYQTGMGTHANPGALCRLNGGPSGVYFDRDLPQSVYLMWVCGPFGSRYYGCRGQSGVGAEPSNAQPLTPWSFIELRSMRIFVNDNTDPTISFDPGVLNASGGTIAPDQDGSKETLTWTTSDDAGIRQQRTYLNGVLQTGALTQNFTATCDNRYRIPCPLGATAWSAGQRPPTGGSNMTQSWSLDADALPRGLYTFKVEAQDGSGRWSSATASFRVDTARRLEVCDDGGAAPIGAVASNQMRTGVYGADKVTAPKETCAGTSFGDPVASTPTDAAPTTGSLVALPAPGTGIFSYTLAVNSFPGAVPLNPGSCAIRSQVVNGASGGAMNTRELNQIVSVTIDLRSFVKPKQAGSDNGGQLGEHSLRSSFDLPGRATQGYRQALGCPFDALPKGP